MAGDIVVTPDHGPQRVVEVTQSHHAKPRCGGWPHTLRPVCIKAEAFGPRMPHADLWVSAGHGIRVDGEFVTAGSLVNGRTIVRDNSDRDELVYYHLILERQSAVISNGLTTESCGDEFRVLSEMNRRARLRRWLLRKTLWLLMPPQRTVDIVFLRLRGA